MCWGGSSGELVGKSQNINYGSSLGENEAKA